MRTRLVIDPVWKVVRQEEYSAFWKSFQKEAAQCGFVGLDLEWTTRRIYNEEDGEAHRCVGPVAILQLSSTSTTLVVKYIDLCALLSGESRDPLLPLSLGWPDHRVGARENSRELLQQIQDDLHSVLRDATIFKVGAGIRGDQHKLENEYAGVCVNGCVDLSVLAQELMNADVLDSLRFPYSLKDLTALFTEYTLQKEYYVVTSDWGGSLGALSPLQVHYAASDAEASFDVCDGILRRANVEVDTCRELLASLVGKGKGPLHGRSYAIKKHYINSEDNKYKKLREKCRGREKPYYDNIFVYAKDGSLAFTVDSTKADWYVRKKGLATVMEWAEREDGERAIASIQLTFNPDFEKFNDAHIRRDMEYFKQPKENICVVCGNGESLVRFAIVPFMYRKHFPTVYMSHNSYDLVLLCTSCFAKARQYYDTEIGVVAQQLGVPAAIPTPSQLQAFNERIARLEIDGVDSSATECFISLETRTRLMKEFAQVCHHREILVRLFKFANTIESHRRGEASIPPNRLQQMEQHIEAHCGVYPFYDRRSSSQEEQNNVFEQYGPTSPEGIHFILNGRPDNSQTRSAREVLSFYWFLRNPDVARKLALTTRLKERQMGGPEVEEEEQAVTLDWDLPLVDSHGFFVVWALLEKYTNDENKTVEHATGQFILQWRNFFLTSLQPKHMPSGWSATDGILL